MTRALVLQERTAVPQGGTKTVFSSAARRAVSLQSLVLRCVPLMKSSHAGRMMWMLVCASACFAESPPVGGPPGTGNGDTAGGTIASTSDDSASTPDDSGSTVGQTTRATAEDSGDVTRGESGAVTTANGSSGDDTPTDTGSITGADTSSTTGEPGQWTCIPNYYDNNDGCDCGCGTLDPDCADATAASCDFCDHIGSCGPKETRCPSNIDPDNNARCVD